MAGDCPSCGQLLIIPDYKPPQKSKPPSLATPRVTSLPDAAAESAVPSNEKTMEDYAADAICATTKGAWKAAKVVGPIAGRIAGKVVNRAAKAAVESEVGKLLSEPPKKLANKNEPTEESVYLTEKQIKSAMLKQLEVSGCGCLLILIVSCILCATTSIFIFPFAGWFLGIPLFLGGLVMALTPPSLKLWYFKHFNPEEYKSIRAKAIDSLS